MKKNPNLVGNPQATSEGRKVIETIVIAVVSHLLISSAIVLLLGALLCLAPPFFIGILFLIVGTILAIVAVGISLIAGIILVWTA